MIGVEIYGVSDLLNDFKGYKKETDKAINRAVSLTALAVERDAKARISGGLGSIKHRVMSKLYTSIRRNKALEKDQFEAVVGSFNCKYAPYIEFGTGELVFQNFDFDEQAKAVAAEFKGKAPAKHPIRGDSFLNFAAVKNQNKFIEFLENELNKIAR